MKEMIVRRKGAKRESERLWEEGRRKGPVAETLICLHLG